MSLNVRFTTARAVEPVSLADLKRHVNQTSTEDDEKLEAILHTAIENIEAYTSRSLGVRTVIAEWTRTGALKYPLPYGPVVSVTTVTKVFEDGTTENLTENTDYYVEGMDDKTVRLHTYWGSSSGTIQVGFRITYQAGYSRGYSATTTKIPEPLRRAIMKQAGYMYEYALCNPGGGYLLELKEDVLQDVYPFLNASILI